MLVTALKRILLIFFLLTSLAAMAELPARQGSANTPQSDQRPLVGYDEAITYWLALLQTLLNRSLGKPIPLDQVLSGATPVRLTQLSYPEIFHKV